MLFDEYDFEFLRLCGVCRYVPTKLLRKYDSPCFSGSVISTLKKHGLIKTQSDKLSYKLTYEGKEVLREMGYTFPDDARMDLKRPAYKRKLKNALWNILLHLSGIDIYQSKVNMLAGMNTGYVSSLTLRGDANIRVLAGTRFLGILKIENTAYVPYYLETSNDWIIPGFERDIYRAQIDAIKNIVDMKIILTGDTLEELWSNIHPESTTAAMTRGMKRFDIALEELGSEYLLVPLGRDGVLQMSLLQIRKYRERIITAIGCRISEGKPFFECDGVKDGIPYIVAVDFNVKRIIRALRQTEKYDREIVPRICCLPFQKRTIFKLLKEHNAQKTVVLAIDKESIYNIFPEIVSRIKGQTPYKTKEGKYINANERKIKKSDYETL